MLTAGREAFLPEVNAWFVLLSPPSLTSFTSFFPVNGKHTARCYTTVSLVHSLLCIVGGALKNGKKNQPRIIGSDSANNAVNLKVDIIAIFKIFL